MVIRVVIHRCPRIARDNVVACAVSFMLNFVSCWLGSNFIFSFCGCPFFSSSSGMVTTTPGMFSLLPIGRHLCSFARNSDTGHAASDCSVGKTAPCYPPPCKSAPTTRSHQVSPSNHPAFSVPFPTLFLESGPPQLVEQIR
mgnify:CR=1 FL=1